MSAPPTGPRTEGGQHVSTEQGPRPHRVLVLNSGSSSVKYQLLDMADSSRLAVGLVERIGEETSRIVHTPLTEGTGGEREMTGRVADHQAALEAVAAELAKDGLGLDSPNWRRSGTGWCTADGCSPGRPSSTTRCSPRSSGWSRWRRCTTRPT